MNISTHLLNNYDSGMQGQIRSEQTKESGNTSSVRNSVDLSALKEGAVFKGEILDIAGDKVSIALENQTKILARLQDGVELGVGDRLLFGVKENHNNQILIKPLFDSLYSAQTQTLEKALDAAGLSPTERNFSAAKELMDAGMPVDKGNIVKILSQSMKYEGTSMQTLVALNKLNIPVNGESISQFERYQNYSHQLSGDIKDTAESIADFVKAVPQDTSADTLLSLAEKIIDIFSEDKALNMQQEVSAVVNHLEQEENDGSNGRTMEEGKSASIEAETDAGKAIDTAKAGDNQGNGMTSGLQSNIDEKALKEAEQTVIDSKGNVDNGKKTMEQTAESSGIDKEMTKNLGMMLEKSGMTNSQTSAILQNASSLENVLKQITQQLAGYGADAAIVRNVLSSDEFKKMLSELVEKSWSLDPKTMKNPKEIDELYEKITKQSKEFEQALASKGGSTEEFGQNSQNMRQNMHFMEQLNNQMIYAQMPLKLSNQNANSELFVYADKRKLAEKQDGISVMLHLDMDHLGTTDIKVTLNGTNVNARFYLNDQQSVDIIADNMEELADQLKERGFSLTNEVIQRKPQESINKVVDEIIDENAERSIKRYTFDMRT